MTVRYYKVIYLLSVSTLCKTKCNICESRNGSRIQSGVLFKMVWSWVVTYISKQYCFSCREMVLFQMTLHMLYELLLLIFFELPFIYLTTHLCCSSSDDTSECLGIKSVVLWLSEFPILFLFENWCCFHIKKWCCFR